MKVRIDSADKREDLPDYDLEVPCPACGRNDTLDAWFGIAGGGYGPYTFCNICNIVVSKTCEDDES